VRRVLIESPFAAANGRTREDNIAYARACLRDSLARKEAPLASHLLYPQALNDDDPTERELGIKAGLVWGTAANVTIAYVDHGISDGMKRGIERAQKEGRPIEYRRLQMLESIEALGQAYEAAWSGIVVHLERDIVVRLERDTPHVVKTAAAGDLLSHEVILALEMWLSMWLWEKTKEYPPRCCLACEYKFCDSRPPPAFVVMYPKNPHIKMFSITGICANCAQKSDAELLTIGSKGIAKRTEKDDRAQAQMQYLACLAHNVKVAVETLEDEFCGLADWPERLGETMPQLAAAASAVAEDTYEWAQLSSADFDPSDPTTFKPGPLK
jgi:hypothetical protein